MFDCLHFTVSVLVGFSHIPHQHFCRLLSCLDIESSSSSVTDILSKLEQGYTGKSALE